MGRTFRKQKRTQRGREDDWGSKPKSGKGHKADRARVRQALRLGDEEFE